MNFPAAIVIGCHVNGYGVIRSLSQKDMPIVAMYYDDQSAFAQVSRHVVERLKIPSPRTNEKEFVDFLIANAHRWPGALIIETNDDVASAVARHKKQLQEHYRIIVPEWDVLRMLVEKPLTYQLAQECGVPYPWTFFAHTRDELTAIRQRIVYPCILKPVIGHLFFGQFKCKSFKVNHFAELSEKFDQAVGAGHEMMIQEIIPGPDSNIYQCAMYIDTHGQLQATFFMRKIRQNPPGFGVARVAISHEIIPELAAQAKMMLEKIGFTGIAHSEFKRDDRDGTFKLIEINGRISRSNWLTTHSGVNLPALAYADVNGLVEPIATDYRKDVIWIEAMEDIANSLWHKQEENIPMSEFFAPYLSNSRTFADIASDDLRPFLKRIANLLIVTS